MNIIKKIKKIIEIQKFKFDIFDLIFYLNKQSLCFYLGFYRFNIIKFMIMSKIDYKG